MIQTHSYYFLSDLINELKKLPAEAIANKDYFELIDSFGEFSEASQFDLLAVERRPSDYDDNTIALVMGLRALGIEEDNITIVSFD